jgi:hypothetical protein
MVYKGNLMLPRGPYAQLMTKYSLSEKFNNSLEAPLVKIPASESSESFLSKLLDSKSTEIVSGLMKVSRNLK